MKKLFMISMILWSMALMADDSNIKVVYDLTTKNLATFERNILKGIAINKTYYDSKLKEFDVTVVVHGGAYRFFVNDINQTIFADDKKLLHRYEEIKKRVANLNDTYGVEFLMCGAAMDRNRLKEKDIVKFVTIIPNSTIGLIDRQNSGYAYIPVGD